MAQGLEIYNSDGSLSVGMTEPIINVIDTIVLSSGDSSGSAVYPDYTGINMKAILFFGSSIGSSVDRPFAVSVDSSSGTVTWTKVTGTAVPTNIVLVTANA